jgi:arylsulfatase A-like enzyme
MPRARAAILAALGLAGCAAAPAPRLFLLVTVDTLRADRLGAYGSDRGLTPRIDALARESQVFTSAYAPASHTLPSVAALLTGQLPQEIGVVDNLSRLPPEASTLASDLAARGFSTGAVVSNWVLRRASGLDAGFSAYDDELPQVESARGLAERIARETTDAARRQLAECAAEPERRCFLWVHYQDPHGPYTPPGGRESRLARERLEPDGRRLLPLLDGPFGRGGIPSYQLVEGEREVAFYRAGYDAEIAYLDAELGRLLDEVRARGPWERAVVVFTADHGESLGEGDYWFGHGEDLSEVLVRVPLLLRVPGLAPAARPDAASLVDLRATLLALATGEPAPEGGRGRDLLAPDAASDESSPFLATLGGARVAHYGLVEGRFKYVVSERDGEWLGRLTERGDDSTDLAAPAPHVARAMRTRLEAILRSLPQPETSPRAAGDEEERAHLRALGYLGR